MEREKYFADESTPVASEKSSPFFDCSICLDFAKDPVVTLCGHLYCWPCIYKWLSFENASTDSDDKPQCPVCKAEISHTSIVPLYGHGKTLSADETDCKAANTGTAVPPRPLACNSRALTTTSNPTQQFTYRNAHQHRYGRYDTSRGLSSHNVGSPNPNSWMYGEMVYARMFGNSERFYTFPNSSSPELSLQEMQAHKSLSRVAVFLLCCSLCLLLL